jgi:predicted acetylornithine/succinylornithine family transaminase
MNPTLSSKSLDVMNQESTYIAKTFNRLPVVWERGDGCRLWDVEGKRYLDFFSGQAVMNLGYNHPGQKKAMQEQLDKLVHTGNLFYLKSQIELARLLVEKTFGDKVFFSNSGAEIVELSIKVARKWAKNRHEIIAMRNSFHGRTFGALSATGQDKYRQGITPMLPGFKHVAFNDLTAAASAISDQTCAILIEPVQGEGGVLPADPVYLKNLRELCTRNNLLLIFDEIQCGLGRSGWFNAYEHFQVVPDMLLLAKPLGGGLPISALVTREDIASAMQVGDHGTTFGGNPVAAAGGIVLMNELSKPGFLEKVREMSGYLRDKLQELTAQFPGTLTASRGLGMMWGLEAGDKAQVIVTKALEQGLVLNCTAGKIVRLLPSLVVGKAEVDEACTIMQKVIAAL